MIDLKRFNWMMSSDKWDNVDFLLVYLLTCLYLDEMKTLVLEGAAMV